MSQFRNFDSINEYINMKDDEIAIIDGIKQAEKQCDDLRDQLKRLWKILSRNHGQLTAVESHRAAASGEGSLRPQISNYESAESILQQEPASESIKGEYYTKKVYKPKQQPSKEDVRNLRKNLTRYFVGNEEIKPENNVITLFKKQNTQCSLPGSGDSETRKNLQTETVKISVDGRSHIDCSHIKQVAKDQALPFIVGKSTSQSHNICLNFQEVLAKMKRRRPEATEEHKEKAAIVTGKGNLHSGAGDVVVHEPMSEQQTMMVLSDNLRTTKFKEVLKNLYKEFTAMAHEYEKLMEAYTRKEPNKFFLKKELKKLENILAQKEDEIIVLLSMYRQVMSMKEEVTRSNELAMRPQRNNQQLSNTTNLRLKILLQQMRKLQLNL